MVLTLCLVIYEFVIYSKEFCVKRIRAWNSTTVKLHVIKGQLEDKSETSSQYLGHENQPPNRGLRKRQATSSK